MAQQVLRVRGQKESFSAPVGQAKQRADAQAAKSRCVGPLRGFEPPIEIALRSGGVHSLIHLPVVCFLVNHQPFSAGQSERAIGIGIQRPDFERDTRDFSMQCPDTLTQVINRHEFRMFAGHEEQVTKSLCLQSMCFANDLID
jgi:hypothetical protein